MAEEYTRRLSILGNIPQAGPIMFFDDFAGPLSWSKVDGAGDAIFELDPTVFHRGSQSLYLETRTAGKADDDAISATHFIPMTTSRKLSISALIRALPDGATLKHLALGFHRTIPNDKYIGNIRRNGDTGIFQYLNSADAWQDIPGSDIDFSQYHFHRLTLELDFLNNKYISFTFNDHFFSLANIDLRTAVSVTPDSIATIEIISGAFGPPHAYINEILITEI